MPVLCQALSTSIVADKEAQDRASQDLGGSECPLRGQIEKRAQCSYEDEQKRGTEDRG